MKSGAVIFLLCVIAQSRSATAARAPLVLLFDKHCTNCSDSDLRSRRQLGAATLSVLERQDESFFVRERWRANYGAHDGPKECLADMRTPVGLYYTKEIHDQNVGRVYGYTSILLDYPNADDKIGVAKPSLARRCVGAGAFIAIHGGLPGKTRGCIRLLDDVPPRNQIHYSSIRKLASLIRSKNVPSVPVISVDVANPGCHAAIGASVSQSCALALSRIVDSQTRPDRGLVLRWLQDPAPPASQATKQPPLVALSDIWATGEARVCGPAGNEPCLARYLLDGNASTMWCDNGDADSDSRWIAVRLAQPGPVSRVVLRNGSWQKEREKWYGFVEQLEVRFAGQTAECAAELGRSTELACRLFGTVGDALLLRLRRSRPGSIFSGVCITDLMVFADE